VILTWQNWDALLKGISIEAGSALALGHVVSNCTFGVEAANARSARVNTFQVNTCLISTALRAEHTFRSTPSCGITLVIRQTGAKAVGPNYLVVSVRSTRVGTARIARLRFGYNALCF
jgi:hypothetical protein